MTAIGDEAWADHAAEIAYEACDLLIGDEMIHRRRFVPIRRHQLERLMELFFIVTFEEPTELDQPDYEALINGLHDLRSSLRDRTYPDREKDRSPRAIAQDIQGILDDLWTIREW